MKTHKITVKLFLVTVVALMALLGMQFIFQSIYLERFYTENKKTTLSRSLDELGEELVKSNAEINKELLLFSQELGGATGIVDLYGNPLYGFNSQRSIIEVIGIDGQQYRIYADGFTYDENFSQALKKGKQIEVKGHVLYGEGIEVYPSEINIDGKSYPKMLVAVKAITTNEAALEIPSDIAVPKSMLAHEMVLVKDTQPMEMQVIQGTITSYYIPDENSYGNGYRESKVLEETYAFLTEAIRNHTQLVYGQPMIYERMDTFVGVNNLVGFIPIDLDGIPVLLVTMVSLQQVEEAVKVMNEFAILLSLVALVVAVVMAYFYARNITRPLVQLNNITGDIAKLDFSQQCVVRSNDEIGQLANNINIMSNQLKETLESLQQDIELKEQLNQQRKQFIMDVSHELKTPLTVLKASCEGMIHGVYDPMEQKNFYHMLSQIDDMGELVQELLDIAKLEDGEVIKQEVFELSDIVLKLHRKLKPIVQEKEIQVDLDLEDNLVLGEQKKIETVIRNLYNNAIFYTPNGGQIKIIIERQEDEVFCAIENYGVTIPTEDIEKIWDAFYRVEQSRNRSLGGSGLGLYIVKQILDKHNTSFGLENVDGGVRAWFRLRGIDELVDG